MHLVDKRRFNSVTRASFIPAVAMVPSDDSTPGHEHRGQLYLATCLPDRPIL